MQHIHLHSITIFLENLHLLTEHLYKMLPILQYVSQISSPIFLTSAT